MYGFILSMRKRILSFKKNIRVKKYDMYFVLMLVMVEFVVGWILVVILFVIRLGKEVLVVRIVKVRVYFEIFVNMKLVIRLGFFW